MRGKHQRDHTWARWPWTLALGSRPRPSALSGSEQHVTETEADVPGTRSARGHHKPSSGGGSGPRANRRVWTTDMPALTHAAWLWTPSAELGPQPPPGSTCSWGSRNLEDFGAFVQQVRSRGGTWPGAPNATCMVAARDQPGEEPPAAWASGTPPDVTLGGTGKRQIGPTSASQLDGFTPGLVFTRTADLSGQAERAPTPPGRGGPGRAGGGG